VFEHYGMAHEKHAKALKRRVADLLDGGFERALLLAYSRQRRGNGEDYGNDFYYGVAPPCCATEEGACKIRGADGALSSGEVWAGNGAGAEARALWREGEVKMPKGSSGNESGDGELPESSAGDDDAETARRRRLRRRSTARRLFGVAASAR
jgi:hypothetical protein